MTLSLPAPNGPREDSQDRADSASPGAGAPHDFRDHARSSEEPSAKTRQHRSARGAAIPGVDEILALLLQLNGAVVIGVIKPAQANVIQRNLRTMLDVQLARQTAGTSSASTEDLAALLRAEPALMDVMAPFLTNEQVDWLLRQSDEPSE